MLQSVYVTYICRQSWLITKTDVPFKIVPYNALSVSNSGCTTLFIYLGVWQLYVTTCMHQIYGGKWNDRRQDYIFLLNHLGGACSCHSLSLYVFCWFKRVYANLILVWPCMINNEVKKTTRCNTNSLLLNPNELDMFRATLLPILRSIRLYTTACGMLYPRRCRSVTWWRRKWQFLRHQITHRQRIGYNIPQAVVYSLMLLRIGKSVARNMSSSFGFIDKFLVLHLVGFLFYLSVYAIQCYCFMCHC